jgi:hypothetical protein
VPQVFCVDPERDKYEPKIAVKALVDRVWFDEGHKFALKDEAFKVDELDAEILVTAGHVKRLGGESK